MIAWLRDQGHQVTESTKDENHYQDIDCWVNGKPFSIKAQHKSLASSNIGLEIASQLTAHKSCEASLKFYRNMYDMSSADVLSGIEDLVRLGSWEYGWYPGGKAENYLILRGHFLHFYKKSHIQKYISTNGFMKLRPLSKAVQDTQGGSYRYCNTVSGYLMTNAVPNRLFEISDFITEYTG